MAQRKGKWSELSDETRARYVRKLGYNAANLYESGASIYKKPTPAKVSPPPQAQPPAPQGTVLPGIDPPPGLTVDFETRTLFREGQLQEIVAEQTAFIQGFLAAAGGNRDAMTSGCSEVRIDPLEETMTTRKGLIVEPGLNRWQVEQDIWYEKS